MIIIACATKHGLYQAQASRSWFARRNQTLLTRWPGYSCWRIVPANFLKPLFNWIEHRAMKKNINDIKVNSGQMSTGVEILLKMSHKTLTGAKEDIQ
jgi:hypothetical protein